MGGHGNLCARDVTAQADQMSGGGAAAISLPSLSERYGKQASPDIDRVAQNNRISSTARRGKDKSIKH